MNTLRSLWNQMPAVRLLLPFMAGIGLCLVFADPRSYSLWLAVAVLILSMAVLVYINNLSAVAKIYKWRYASGIAVSVAMLCGGYTVAFLNTDVNDPHHIEHLNDDFKAGKIVYTGIITDPPVVRDKTISTLLQLQKISKNDTTIEVGGKVLASIVKDSSSETLRYGDKIVFSGLVSVYEEPKNPGQFNYKHYQAMHHVYDKVYLRASQWQVTGSGLGNSILSKVYDVRGYFLSLIKQSVSDTNALAVATAIMLGYRDYVTDEVTQAYAGSGVLHVLSVSGLHVAVLYFVLNLLFGWMDKRRRTEIIKGVLVIVIMLFYAGLTGLSPPVLRSVWMFTLITVARLLDRDVSIYNVLAVSCLGLLIWDPYYIADVGFQLSYIAVAGIVYLYPLFHVLLSRLTFSFKKPFGFAAMALTYLYDFVWGLICVSIAAQLATFPISLYYFHTFPNFFLLSNLLVIPLSNFVLISGMALFVVGWWHWLFVYIGWLFDHLLLALNMVVFRIDSLPFALTKGMVIGLSEMVLLYIAMMIILWFIADRRAKVLLLSLFSMLLLCTAFSIGSIRKDKMKKLVVYDVKGEKAIAFIIHRHVFYDFDSALINNEMLMRYNVRDHWWQCGVETVQVIDSTGFGYELPYGKLYAIGGKRIIVIDKEITYSRSAKLKADVVILSGNNYNNMDEINKRIECKEIVFDTSNKPAHIKHWSEDCERLKLNYHDCRDKAFEMEL